MSSTTTQNDTGDKSPSSAASTAQFHIWCEGDDSWLSDRNGTFVRNRDMAYIFDAGDSLLAQFRGAYVAVPTFHDGQFRLFIQTEAVLKLHYADMQAVYPDRVAQDQALERMFRREVLDTPTMIRAWADFVKNLTEAKPMIEIIRSFLIANGEGATFATIFEEVERKHRFYRFDGDDVISVLNELVAERKVVIESGEPLGELGLVFAAVKPVGGPAGIADLSLADAMHYATNTLGVGEVASAKELREALESLVNAVTSEVPAPDSEPNVIRVLCHKGIVAEVDTDAIPKGSIVRVIDTDTEQSSKDEKLDEADAAFACSHTGIVNDWARKEGK